MNKNNYFALFKKWANRHCWLFSWII